MLAHLCLVIRLEEPLSISQISRTEKIGMGKSVWDNRYGAYYRQDFMDNGFAETSSHREQVTLRSQSAEAVVDLIHGARLSSLRIHTALCSNEPSGQSDTDKVEILWGTQDHHASHSDPLSWGSFVMAPFAGRIRDGHYRVGDRVHQLRLNHEPHSIHGTVCDRRWELLEHTATSLHCVTDLGEHWPFAGRCHQRITMGDDRISFSLSVESAGEGFWVSLGWHPWFRTELASGEHLTLQAQPGLQVLRDGAGLPTSIWVPPRDDPWDDCFAQPNWPVTLCWGERLRLDIHSDCNYLVIFNELAHAWCVEPQTAPPNSFTDRTQWVDATHTHEAHMTWSW